MYDPFERMNQSIFARLGKDAFLRGSPCKASVSFGVEVVLPGEFSDVTAHKTVVEVFYADLSRPCKGDEVVVSGNTYKLDVLLKDDHQSARWIVL